MSQKTNQCRVCLENVKNFKEFTDILSQETDYIYEPKEETVRSAFSFCTKLGCPDQNMVLCISCTKSLKFSYDFIRQAMEADVRLRQNNFTVTEKEDSSNEEQEIVKLEDAFMLIEEIKDTKDEDTHATESQDSIDDDDLVETVEEEYILEMNENDSVEQVESIDTSLDVSSTDKRLLKNRKYVSRKEIPANFTCTQCCKSFVHNFLLKSHIKQHHDPSSKERNWSCTKCDKSFFRKEVLSRHLLTVHREGRDYKCTICGKEFQYKERLTRHLRIHIDRRFQCTICDKRYVQNADLNVHMRTHTNEKPFKCETCFEAFASKSRLTVHVNRKHLDLIYKCKYCSVYECKSYGSMRRHEIEHLKCPFQCPNCSRGFSRKKRFLF
ncbi:hypothetical protein ACFFRR_011511 [Megaselia abdita]